MEQYKSKAQTRSYFKKEQKRHQQRALSASHMRKKKAERANMTSALMHRCNNQIVFCKCNPIQLLSNAKNNSNRAIDIIDLMQERQQQEVAEPDDGGEGSVRSWNEKHKTSPWSQFYNNGDGLYGGPRGWLACGKDKYRDGGRNRVVVGATIRPLSGF
jgi:hypothetical protein